MLRQHFWLQTYTHYDLCTLYATHLATLSVLGCSKGFSVLLRDTSTRVGSWTDLFEVSQVFKSGMGARAFSYQSDTQSGTRFLRFWLTAHLSQWQICLHKTETDVSVCPSAFVYTTNHLKKILKNSYNEHVLKRLTGPLDKIRCYKHIKNKKVMMSMGLFSLSAVMKRKINPQF